MLPRSFPLHAPIIQFRIQESPVWEGNQRLGSMDGSTQKSTHAMPHELPHTPHLTISTIVMIISIAGSFIIIVPGMSAGAGAPEAKRMVALAMLKGAATPPVFMAMTAEAEAVPSDITTPVPAALVAIAAPPQPPAPIFNVAESVTVRELDVVILWVGGMLRRLTHDSHLVGGGGIVSHDLLRGESNVVGASTDVGDDSKDDDEEFLGVLISTRMVWSGFGMPTFSLWCFFMCSLLW